MSSNMPPGVLESMIPGNRPEDLEWDELIEWLASIGLEPVEIKRRITSKIWNKKP